jgi:hypothetical protein
MKKETKSKAIAFIVALVVWMVALYIYLCIDVHKDYSNELTTSEIFYASLLIFIKPIFLIDSALKFGILTVVPLLTFLFIRRRLSK